MSDHDRHILSYASYNHLRIFAEMELAASHTLAPEIRDAYRITFLDAAANVPPAIALPFFAKLGTPDEWMHVVKQNKFENHAQTKLVLAHLALVAINPDTPAETQNAIGCTFRAARRSPNLLLRHSENAARTIVSVITMGDPDSAPRIGRLFHFIESPRARRIDFKPVPAPRRPLRRSAFPALSMVAAAI